jgi:hypothetical protein
MTVASIPRPGRQKDQSARELLTELFRLVVAYARQETVDPLKSLLRYVLWGVSGAVLLATGSVLLALAVVRLLETETGRHLSGSLTWVPYAGGLIFGVAVAGAAISRISKVSR